MQQIFIAWPRTMNIGQIDISFTVVFFFSHNRHRNSNEILSTCSIKMKGYTKKKKKKKKKEKKKNECIPASILRKSTSGRHRPVSYPDGPMTARYRFT